MMEQQTNFLFQVRMMQQHIFESTCLDILDVYRRIMGEPFDFTKITRGLDADDSQEGVH